MKKLKMPLRKRLAVLSVTAAMLITSSGMTVLAEDNTNLSGYDQWPVPQLQSNSFTSFGSKNDVSNQSVHSVSIDDNGDYLLTGTFNPDTTTLNLPEMENAAYTTAVSQQAGLPNANPDYVVKMKKNMDGSLTQDWVQSLYAVQENENYMLASYAQNTCVTFQDATQLTDGSYAAVGTVKIQDDYNVGDKINLTIKDLNGNSYPLSFQSSYYNMQLFLTIVIHMQPDGKIDWFHTTESTGSNSLSSVKATSDGGFVTVGYDNGKKGDYVELYQGENSSLSSNGGLIIKYDKITKQDSADMDSVLYSKSMVTKYVNEGASLFIDVIPVSDGYVLSGKTRAVSYGDPIPSSIISTSDGIKYNLNTNSNGGLIMKVDLNGNINWIYQNEATNYYRMFQDENGNIIAAGERDVVKKGISPVMTKLDSSGNQLAERIMIGSGNTETDEYGSTITLNNKFYDVIPSEDGGYIFGGSCESPLENDFAVPQVGGQQNQSSQMLFIVKTDSDFKTEGIFYVAPGDLDNIENYNMLAEIKNGFVIAGSVSPTLGQGKDFSAFDFGVKKQEDGQYYRAGFVTDYTYDWDGDGIVNTRDYYPYDSSRYLPDDPDDFQNKIDLEKEPADNARFEKALSYRDISAFLPTNNFEIRFDGATLRAPGIAFDTLFDGTKKNLTFSFQKNQSQYNMDGSRYIGAFDLTMMLGDSQKTTFGTDVSVTVPISGISNPDKAKLYYDNAGELVPIENAFFTSDRVTFKTNHFSTYVVMVSEPAVSNNDVNVDKNTGSHQNSADIDVSAKGKFTNTGAESINLSAPSTGDKASYIPAALLFTGSLGVLAGSILWNKQKRKMRKHIL